MMIIGPKNSYSARYREVHEKREAKENFNFGQRYYKMIPKLEDKKEIAKENNEKQMEHRFECSDICEVHQEKIVLFCQNNKKLICIKCHCEHEKSHEHINKEKLKIHESLNIEKTEKEI